MKFLCHYVQCVDGKTTQICVDPHKIKAVHDWPRPRRPDFSLNALTWLKPDDDLFKRVRSAAKQDDQYTSTLAAVMRSSRHDFQILDDLLYKGSLLYIPQCDMR
jgi:hypothetical protein